VKAATSTGTKAATTKTTTTATTVGTCPPGVGQGDRCDAN